MIDVVFLDLDGVTHPLFPRTDLPYTENANFVYLDAVLATIDEVAPGAAVVVTSSWRLRPDFKASIPRALQQRMAGSTPCIRRLYDGAREDEAYMWITKHFGGVESKVRWLAIDDTMHLWRSQHKLLLCNDGFRDSEIRELKANAEAMFDSPPIQVCGVII